MKRLGLIIAMALVLTVGGVYATFNYAQDDVSLVNEDLNKTIAGTREDTAKGTIGIDVRGFTIRVDDKGVLEHGEGNGTLVTGYQNQGTVQVTFTPAKGADATVTDEGVTLKLTISFSNNKYNGTDIFKTTGEYPATGVPLGKGTKNDVTGVFEYDVELGKYLAVNEISLPTKSDYDNFLIAYGNAKITVTVSEVKP